LNVLLSCSHCEVVVSYLSEQDNTQVACCTIYFDGLAIVIYVRFVGRQKWCHNFQRGTPEVSPPLQTMRTHKWVTSKSTLSMSLGQTAPSALRIVLQEYLQRNSFCLAL